MRDDFQPVSGERLVFQEEVGVGEADKTSEQKTKEVEIVFATFAELDQFWRGIHAVSLEIMSVRPFYNSAVLRIFGLRVIVP